MTVQLAISYETLVDLIDQLSPEERQELARRLDAAAKHAPVATAEWQAAFRALAIDLPLGGPVPLRRAEWYDDDGR
jgi:hypothetical protein